MLGAEISGIDLSRPVDAGTKRELNELFARYGVLVFREQPLTPPQFMLQTQIAVTRLSGFVRTVVNRRHQY